MAREINRFTVGGTNGHPSIPQGRIAEAIGDSTIQIDVFTRTLSVPTPSGIKIARPGDTIVAYDDDTFEVEYA